ncbi:MAG: hypothetical protein WA212_16240 [Candidatus Acidiferrales bacterium]
MGSIGISLITFMIICGGAVLGMALPSILPQHSLDADSRDAVKLGMALVSTMVALVLGLLIGSAKSSLDTQNAELTEMSSRIVLLDRLLALYGPETKEARDDLRGYIARVLDMVSTKEADGTSGVDLFPDNKSLYDEIEKLSPKDDAQSSIKIQALSILLSLGQTRWLIAAQSVNSVPLPLLIVLTFWLAIVFTSFGLFAPRNATVVVSLLISALSVSGAIFLIVQMYSPYAGLIRVSSAPFRAALTYLGQ